jgi:hypothetical protein
MAAEAQPVTPAVQFFGRVYPAGLTINANAPGVRYLSDDGTITGTIDVAVVDSEISVSWHTSNYDRKNLWPFWAHAQRITVAVVDLIAFRGGYAATVILDRYREDNGFEEGISFAEPAVASLAPVLSDDAGLLAVFDILAGEQHLMVVMEDLIAGLWSQDHKVINCARSVEAIRQLIAGYSLEPKKQWPVLNDRLNLAPDYTALIMKHSHDPRHGKRPVSSPQEVTEIMRRTWIIFNRYFEYKLRGEKKLDVSTFPVLQN